MNAELNMTMNPHKGTLKRLLWITPLAIMAASPANIGLYYAAGILFPAVTDWPGAGVGQIVGASAVYLMIGAVVLAITTRISPRPAQHYLVLALIGLFFSFGLPISASFGNNPPGASPADPATVITLSLMHLVSFLISVLMFIRLGLIQGVENQ